MNPDPIAQALANAMHERTQKRPTPAPCIDCPHYEASNDTAFERRAKPRHPDIDKLTG